MQPVLHNDSNGTLRLVDHDRADEPLATLSLFTPLRELAASQPELVANTILEAIVDAQRHPSKVKQGKAA